MATAVKTTTTTTGFQYGPLIAGWLIPGAGHFYQRKWIRGSLLLVSISAMFFLGIAMQGELHGPSHELLNLLSFVGDLGTGLLYIVSHAAGLGADPVQITTADYGSRFIVFAGLLNIIAAVDAHNLYTGRKG